MRTRDKLLTGWRGEQDSNLSAQMPKPIILSNNRHLKGRNRELPRKIVISPLVETISASLGTATIANIRRKKPHL